MGSDDTISAILFQSGIADGAYRIGFGLPYAEGGQL